jgi:DNA (cytosine-5)-methyltransferase 1
MNTIPTFLVVDLFCGAGGVTTGFALSGVAKVVACVNHDHMAILSHWSNHKDVVHFEEDIRTLELGPLREVVLKSRAEYPDARLILWASLECTNFSKAKGGLARDADSRTLADHLHRYITAIDPDYVMIENVVEFLDWGPTQEKMKDGKRVVIKNKHGEHVYGHVPIPEAKGSDFKRWCGEICAHGYDMEWRKMNSADFGAYTSRARLFGMFARKGAAMVWPEPTHGNNGKGGLTRWNAVKELIDFSDEGYSIFYRGSNMGIPKRQRKDLSENTLERVYAGCIKHIAGGKENFMIKYHGGKPRTNDTEKPLTVIDTENRHAVVNASFITQRNSGEPFSKVVDINGPARTITATGGNQDVVNVSFLSMYHGNGDNTHSVDGPAPVIAAADVSAVCFIDRQFSGGGQNSSVESPAGAIMAVPKLNLVQAEMAFVDTTQYKNKPTSVAQPLSTITANRKYPCLISLQWGGQVQEVGKPAPVLLATGNKTPLYLLVIEGTESAIPVYDTDSEIVKKLKEFMALYRIGDIKMRMLRVDELLVIQGFPKWYNLLGTQSDQKKFIGNSVVPDVVRAWALAMHEGIVNKAKVP